MGTFTLKRVIGEAVNAGVDMLVTSNGRIENFEDYAMRGLCSLCPPVRSEGMPPAKMGRWWSARGV